MRKIVAIIVVVILLAACGSNIWIDGKEKKTVGIVNILVNDPSLFETKDPTIQYRVIWGNVIWGVILSKSIIFPIYFFGFSMFEPIGKLTPEKDRQ